MGKIRLDQNLIKKISKKTNHKEEYVRQRISKQAGKLGITSEAFLVVWAKKENIGTAVYQRNLHACIRTEIRDTLPIFFSREFQKARALNINQKEGARRPRKSSLSLAIEYLIEDEELYSRCRGLIKASKHFDRALREATTVLEDRIKNLSGLEGMKPVNLVGKALNPNPPGAVLKISSKKSEQEGFFNICKGLMLSFRNPTHHKLSDEFTRQDALKFCGFIDSLLRILGQAQKKL